MTSDNRDDAERPRDPTRRQFFRAFSRQTVAGAGNVIGAAETLRRGTSTAASEILGLGFGNPQATAARLQQRLDVGAVSATTTDDPTAQPFASAYAYSDHAILLLDQRRLPASRTTVACTEASEVAAAMRAGVVGAGPILAEVAAHTLVLAVARTADTSTTAHRRAFDTAADTLLAARPSIRAVGWAVERLRRARDRGPAEAHEPGAMVTALRREAEAIAMELALDHARLGKLGAEELGKRDTNRLDLLLHGDMGPLSCGLVGTGFAVVRSLIDGGRDVHVWLTEGGPDVAGGRISALQLRQLDVPHTLVPDAAVGWLFDNRAIDAVLVRLDTVTPHGDGIVPVGGANVARVAASACVAVFGCATTSAIQPTGGRAVDLSTEMGVPEGGTPAATRLQPLADVVPARLMDGCLTEEGLLGPPLEKTLHRALEARDRRQAAGQGIELA